MKITIPASILFGWRQWPQVMPPVDECTPWFHERWNNNGHYYKYVSGTNKPPAVAKDAAESYSLCDGAFKDIWPSVTTSRE
jgi:hypothetical protein